jgi:2-polyprenyl-3-methyl-5-hydroxy-6-metoxy-1,4-benzoquinol methylase
MEKQHVCPWWLGYFLINPLRKFQHNPHQILGQHVKAGMNILDFGSAMGYFSIPLAQLTGDKGKVYCVDIQEKMLKKLMKRANKANVGNIVKPLLVGKNFKVAELQGKIDFAILFAVVHEVPDKANLFKDLNTMLKPGAKLLFAEPKGHVTPEDFKKSIDLACLAGFKISEEKPMAKGLSAFLVK